MAQYKLNYPIETENAWAHWSSKHKLNRIKAIISFSLDINNANDNLRRAGYYRQYRKRYLEIYDCLVAKPDMTNVPLSTPEEHWWAPIKICPLTPPLPDVSITALAWDGTSPNGNAILVGYNLQLKAKVTPANTTNQKVNWTSSDPAIEVVADPSDPNKTDAIATAKSAKNDVVITGESDDDATKKITATIDVIAQDSPDMHVYIQNNVNTQTGWLPVQDSTDKNKYTITNALSTATRYMGTFVRRNSDNHIITGATDGLTNTLVVSSDPTIVAVDNIGGHGFQMHPKKIGTAVITITTPSGDGHPATPMVGTLTITLT